MNVLAEFRQKSEVRADVEKEEADLEEKLSVLEAAERPPHEWSRLLGRWEIPANILQEVGSIEDTNGLNRLVCNFQPFAASSNSRCEKLAYETFWLHINRKFGCVLWLFKIIKRWLCTPVHFCCFVLQFFLGKSHLVKNVPGIF